MASPEEQRPQFNSKILNFLIGISENNFQSYSQWWVVRYYQTLIIEQDTFSDQDHTRVGKALKRNPNASVMSVVNKLNLLKSSKRAKDRYVKCCTEHNKRN